jgi:hypothetical protein
MMDNSPERELSSRTKCPKRSENFELAEYAVDGRVGYFQSNWQLVISMEFLFQNKWIQ